MTWYMHASRQVTECNISASDRPVVVIDPDDAEQVERLARCYIEANPAVVFIAHDLAVRNLRNALREFARPTPPKPEEPTGLGAVVEDTEGKHWVRNNPRAFAQWSPANYACDGLVAPYRAWDRIAAVRILSPGVTDA